ncbi:MAG: PucR family transcriptional regulator [Rummeliibacillus sp.]
MNVVELLNLKELSPITLIAGENGISRRIKTVTMMDAPDIMQYLLPNQLIITTAYHLKNNETYFHNLLESMHRAGCAGIAIKKNRFLHTIPEDILELANQLNLAFIQLPEHLSLGEINFLITEKILQNEASLLTEAMDIHHEFTDLILSGRGILPLLQKLSAIIEQKVSLINYFFHPVYTTKHNFYLPPSLHEVIKKGGQYPTLPEQNWSISILDNHCSYTFYPVHTNLNKNYYLVIEGFIKEEQFQKHLFIKQAINVLSFAIMQEQALEQQARSIRNQTLQEFIDSNIQTTSYVNACSEELSLRNDQSYLCIVGRTKQTISTFNSFTLSKLIQQFCEESIKEIQLPIYPFIIHNHLVLLVEIQDHSVNSSLFLTEFLEELELYIHYFLDIHLSFGISNPTRSFIDLQHAYKEAFSAIPANHQSTKTCVHFYRKKGINELLQIIPQNELIDFYQTLFEPLLNLDSEEQTLLLETLYAYLECHCQISETAKKLFVHRNTVIYRLDKCSQLLQKDLKDSEVTIQLRLALRIRKDLKLQPFI